MRPLRKQMQIVLQDPFGSLSPRLTAGQIVTEGLLVHEPSISSRERDAGRAGLRGGATRSQLATVIRMNFPAASASASPSPAPSSSSRRVVVLDEPTSALDRQVQKQIVDLLRDLQTGPRSLLSFHQPRSRRGARHGRPHHGHEGWPHGGAGDARRDLRQSARGLYQAPDGSGICLR